MNLEAGTKVAGKTSPETLQSTTKNCCRISATIRWPIKLRPLGRRQFTGRETKEKFPTVIPRRFGFSLVCCMQLEFTQRDSRVWSVATSSLRASGGSTTSTGLVTYAGVSFMLGQAELLRARFCSEALIWLCAEQSIGTTTCSRWRRSTLSKRLAWLYQS